MLEIVFPFKRMLTKNDGFFCEIRNLFVSLCVRVCKPQSKPSDPQYKGKQQLNCVKINK